MADVLAASVVIPTRDRLGHLEECLTALDAQTASSFEVIVVDDASSDEAGVARVVSGFSRARLVRGGGRGPAAARNLGGSCARAAVVCFTDDDCRPSMHWIEALLREVEAGADVVAGRTLSARRDDPFAEASQTITNHVMEASADRDGNVAFAPSCNVACRAELLSEVPFDETYPLAAGEDREWCRRLHDRGVALVLAPEARVLHDQRLSLRRFWQQQQRYGRGASRWHRSRPRGQRLQPLPFYAALLARGFSQGPAIGTLVVVAQLATCVGIMREVLEAGWSRQRARSGSPAM
jgi:GT2 family glycosyltransferase